jgi:DNA-binding transcriptional MerR regulator
MANNQLYTSGELASACDVTVRTVQYYDNKGLLVPSGYSEGGRRLYTEEDADQLRFIVLLKSLGLGLTTIKGVLDSPNREAILKTLLDEQASRIQFELEDRKQQLDAIKLTRNDLERYGKVITTTKSAMVDRMDSEKARYRWWATMIVVGVLMDIAWIGTLVLGILTGIWWPFPVALVFVVIAGCWVVRRYFYHSTYLCPICGAEFLPRMRAFFFSGHTPRTRKLVCPCCGEKDWCIERYHIEAVDLAPGECVAGTCTCKK